MLIESGHIVHDGPALDVVSAYEERQSALGQVGTVFVREKPNPRFPVPVFLGARIETGGVDGNRFASHGQPLQIVIETNPESTIGRFGIDILVTDRRQRPVTYISSVEMQGLYFEPGDVAQCEIPFLPLAQGVYFVALLAHLPGVQPFDHWSGEVAFDVLRFDPFETGSTLRPPTRSGASCHHTIGRSPRVADEGIATRAERAGISHSPPRSNTEATGTQNRAAPQDVRIGRALGRPIADATNSMASLAKYPRFFGEFADYRRIAAPNSTALEDIYPCLDDLTPTTGFDAHYLYQSVWASTRIASAAPTAHVDVGSDIRFVCNLTAHSDVTFLDIRPLEIDLPRLRSIAGSILSLPLEDMTQESVSCLHVTEHVGLGRYGDPVDPEGTHKASLELQRIVAPGGRLYLSLPVGRERTCFNAHRIHSASSVPRLFPELELIEFSLVDDSGRYVVDTELSAGDALEFGCGLFLFRRTE